MILKRIVFFTIMLTAAVVGFAQSRKPQPKEKAPSPPKPVVKPANPDNTLLWQITGEGLSKPSYLFGTMHILCAKDAQLSAELKKVIGEVDQVFFEVDMDDMQEMMGALKFASMKDGRKLQDLVTPVEYERIQAFFKTHQTAIPLPMMSRFKPYFITALISEGLMDCEEKSSIDQMIVSEVRQLDKNVLGLETIEFQASIFDTIPYEKQAQDLVKYIDSIDSYRKNVNDLVALYRKQDINNMDTLVTQSDPAMSQYMDILLFDRNKRWTSQIEEQVREFSTLFAVGAGHLAGSEGLINLLRQKGFTVKPMPNKTLTQL